MPLALKRRTITIPTTKKRYKKDFQERFDSNVRHVDIAVNGFKLDYQNPEGDRSLNVVEVDTDIVGEPNGRDVTFRVEAHLADKNFDDEYNGYVQVLLIADVA
jgi:hypothetical protein